MQLPIRFSKPLAVSLLLTCCVLASAKKKKVILPDEVLQARTVVVIIDPQAGMDIEDPTANRIARNEVESAFMKWGRFALVSDVSSADLVIVVRKGNDKPAEGTIAGPPNNDMPVTLGRGSRPNPSADSDPSAAQPTMTNDPTSPQPTYPAHPQIEAGQTDDVMTVYRGKRDDALDSPPVWRHSARNALQSPGVPAVDAFEKLFEEAEKQQQQQQANHP